MIIRKINNMIKIPKKLIKKVPVIKINNIMNLQNKYTSSQILKMYKDQIFPPKIYNICKTLNFSLAIKHFSYNKKTNTQN